MRPVMSSFRDYGFDDVLPKPWTLAQLSEVFRRVLAADRRAMDRISFEPSLGDRGYLSTDNGQTDHGSRARLQIT